MATTHFCAPILGIEMFGSHMAFCIVILGVEMPGNHQKFLQRGIG